MFDRCLNQCTYCKTKHARGELGSYEPEEIVARAQQSFEGNHNVPNIWNNNHFNAETVCNFNCSAEVCWVCFHFMTVVEGCVEIWLTSEDLGAYGHDIGVTLPQLLWQLVDVIPEGAMLRCGMTNPPYILEHLEVVTLNQTFANLVTDVIYSSLAGNGEDFKSRSRVQFPTCSCAVWVGQCVDGHEERVLSRRLPAGRRLPQITVRKLWIPIPLTPSP